MSYLGEREDFRGQTISKPPGQNAVRQVSSYLGERCDFAKQNQQSLLVVIKTINRITTQAYKLLNKHNKVGQVVDQDLILHKCFR